MLVMYSHVTAAATAVARFPFVRNFVKGSFGEPLKKRLAKKHGQAVEEKRAEMEEALQKKCDKVLKSVKQITCVQIRFEMIRRYWEKQRREEGREKNPDTLWCTHYCFLSVYREAAKEGLESFINASEYNMMNSLHAAYNGYKAIAESKRPGSKEWKEAYAGGMLCKQQLSVLREITIHLEEGKYDEKTHTNS